MVQVIISNSRLDFNVEILKCMSVGAYSKTNLGTLNQNFFNIFNILNIYIYFFFSYYILDYLNLPTIGSVELRYCQS